MTTDQLTGTPGVVHLPLPKQVRDLWGDLLGRDVSVRPGLPLVPSTRAPATIAVYVEDDLRVAAVFLLDLALSARAGAAIGLMPSDSAEAALESGVLDQTVRENLYEVLNVAAAMFNVEGAPHVRLHELHAVGEPVAPIVLSYALTLGRREDLEVDISGYGTGRLSIVLC